MTNEEMRTEIINFIEEEYTHDADTIILADGLEGSFCGIAAGKGVEPRACYDYERVISDLSDDNDWSVEEAEEYFYFNIADAHVGNNPLFLKKFDNFVG
jgi:hypothetical protein